MPSSLENALTKISYWIENSNSKHAKYIRKSKIDFPELSLQPGQEKEMLELYAGEITFRLSKEIYELYQWHDGNIYLGDISNPVYFVSFDRGFGDYAMENRAFPIFVGDEIYFFVKESSENNLSSPIYQTDLCFGFSFREEETPYELYSPNVTSYMQAMAECIETYDGISAYFLSNNAAERFEYCSYLSEIYKKYGVNTEGYRIWA